MPCTCGVDVAGVERGDLLRAAGRAADVHSAHRALLAQDGRAAGDRLVVRDVPDANARDIGKSFHRWVYCLYGSIGVRGPTYLLDLLKEPVLAVQEFFLLAGQGPPEHLSQPPLRRRHRPPDGYHRRRQPAHRGPDRVLQRRGDGPADVARAGSDTGRSARPARWFRITLVRELGPVLTALMVAGRNASGIASELGSMKVTEQIDAMRALGTDPIQKLVTPRLIATCIMLPLLTVIARFRRHVRRLGDRLPLPAI